nr:hypothetical protein [Tanacetum cinerariifolium]
MGDNSDLTVRATVFRTSTIFYDTPVILDLTDDSLIQTLVVGRFGLLDLFYYATIILREVGWTLAAKAWIRDAIAKAGMTKFIFDIFRFKMFYHLYNQALGMESMRQDIVHDKDFVVPE